MTAKEDETRKFRDGLNEEDKLREAFVIFDTDGSGKLSKDEMLHALRAAGNPINSKTEETLMELVSSLHDGEIGFEEFKHFMTNWKTSIHSKEEVIRILSVFDNSNSGFVQAKQIASLLGKYGKNPLSEKEIQRFVELTCPAGEPEFNYEQFVEFMYSHLEIPARVAKSESDNP